MDQLRPYQRRTVEWLSGRDKSFVCHEPGLGKTACAVVAAAKDPPVLVVCPASVRLHWRAEIARWTADPELASLFDVRSYADPRLADLDPDDYRTVVVDEAHYVKNHEAKRTWVVCRFLHQCQRAIALTGTLVPNRPIELWPTLRAMGLTRLSWMEFALRYCSAFRDEWGRLDARGADRERIPELRRLLRRHSIRYRKRDVLPELPAVEWTVRALDLPVDDQEKELSVRDLRRVSDPVAFEAMSEVLRRHGERKVSAAARRISDLLDDGVEKLVAFCHHRSTIDLLRSDLQGREISSALVRGGMTDEDKEAEVDRFRDDPGVRVFVGQVQSAGVGLDGLQEAASYAVFVEASWVPATLEQAAGRLDRLGQDRPVTCEVLTIHRSIDEHQLNRALQKIDVVESVVPSTEWCTEESDRDRLLS